MFSKLIFFGMVVDKHFLQWWETGLLFSSEKFLLSIVIIVLFNKKTY